jgi:polar amino acid transport system substrate-binding protein
LSLSIERVSAMRKFLSVLLLCLAALPWSAGAAEAAGATGATPVRQPLRVGISEVPPFVIREADGSWQGISIDLWSDVASALGYEFELVPMPFKDLLSSLEAGRVDVAVGALTMTAEREARFDFTHPFYLTGLAIAVPRDSASSTWAVLKRLFSWQFTSVVLGLTTLLLVVGAVLWLLERRRNPSQFGGTPVQGLGHGFWWAAVTMTTVGYGDKAPVTLGGRLVAIVWMFAALIMVSGFTAAITSALTVGRLQSDISGPQDLRRAHVATVAGTVSARYLDGERLRSSAFPDLRSAMQAVQKGEADAVVYDQPILQYRNRELGDGGLRLLPGTFDKQAYAFAVGSGSALREPIGREILRISNSRMWPEMTRRYLGPGPQ